MPKNRIFPALVLATLIPLAVWAQVPKGPAAPGGSPPAASSGAPAPTLPAGVPGKAAAPAGGLSGPATPGVGGLPAAKAPAPSLLPGAGASPVAPPPAVGAAAAPAVVEPPTEADLLLDAAIKKLEALKSVAAEIVQNVDMLGQHFQLKGQYLQAPNHRIYLKLTLSGLGDATGTMLQVCDGALLWDYQEVLKSQGYTKLDVSKIFKRIDNSDLSPDQRKLLVTRIGFSGPESLLSGLRKALKFDRKDEEVYEGKKVWVLRGTWKDYQSLTAVGQPPMNEKMALPAYIPSVATVWVGQEDGWPYKLLLEGRRPSVLEDLREIGPDGKPMGAKGAISQVQPSRILLIYTNVKLDEEIKPESFAFQAPADAQVTDLTDKLLLDVEQIEAAQAEQRKAEAAKDGSELPQSIAVPKPVPEPVRPPIEKPTPPK